MESTQTFKQRQLSNKKKLGALSLEAIAVIAFIAFLITGALYSMNLMFRDGRINDAMTNLQLINTKVNELYSYSPDFTGLDAEKLIRSGNAPSGMINSSRDGLRSYWGVIRLGPTNSDSGTDNTFSVTFENVPSEVCQKLGIIIAGSGTPWQSLDIDGSLHDSIDNQDDNIVDFLFENCVGKSNEMTFTAKAQ